MVKGYSKPYFSDALPFYVDGASRCIVAFVALQKIRLHSVQMHRCPCEKGCNCILRAYCYKKNVITCIKGLYSPILQVHCCSDEELHIIPSDLSYRKVKLQRNKCAIPLIYFQSSYQNHSTGFSRSKGDQQSFQ